MMAHAKPARKSRVAYTERERQELAEVTVDYMDMNCGTLNAFRKAMALMPDGRQRRVLGLSTFPWLLPMVEKIIKDNRSKVATPDAPADTKASDDFAFDLTPQKTAEPAEQPKTMKLEELSFPILIDELIRRASEQISQNIVSQVLTALQPLIKPQVPTSTAVESKAIEVMPGFILDSPEVIREKQQYTTKKKHVMVIGIIGSQRTRIQADYSKNLTFTFAEAGDNLKQLPNKLVNCDHVVVMTKFISHNLGEVLKNSHVKPINVNGGISSLRNILTGVINGAVQ